MYEYYQDVSLVQTPRRVRCPQCLRKRELSVQEPAEKRRQL
jgi:hypothetical protein